MVVKMVVNMVVKMLVNMVVEMLTKVRMSVEEMNNFKYDGNNKMISWW